MCSHESGGDLRRARGGEHYYRLSDDKVQQYASSKVNALVRFKCNDLDVSRPHTLSFTLVTGTKVQILTQLGEQRGGCKGGGAWLPRE